jgi:hypothetical protein
MVPLINLIRKRVRMIISLRKGMAVSAQPWRSSGKRCSALRAEKLTFSLILALAAFYVLTACDMHSTELRMLLEHPASNLTLKTGHEIARTIRDKDKVFGKPVYPKVRISYEPTNHHSRSDVYAEILENLENVGAARKPYNVPSEGGYHGSIATSSAEYDVLVTYSSSESNTVILILTQY